MYESESVQILARLLNDGAKEVKEAYFTNGMRNDAHNSYWTRPGVIKTVSQRFLVKNALDKAPNLVAEAS